MSAGQIFVGKMFVSLMPVCQMSVSLMSEKYLVAKCLSAKCLYTKCLPAWTPFRMATKFINMKPNEIQQIGILVEGRWVKNYKDRIWSYHRYQKMKNRLLKFCYVPATSAARNRLLFFLFLLWPFTVLMKQTRQAVRAIRQSIFLDVYGSCPQILD